MAQCSGYNTPDSQMDDSLIIEPDPFTFRQVGDQVTIHMEGEKITFSKKNSDEKRVI